MKLTKSYLTDLTYRFNGACIEVHKNLGPGLLESVYHKCLKQELMLRDIRFESEKSIQIHYKGLDLEAELRFDLLIEDAIVVELKAVESVLPIHTAQLMSYMKLLDKPKGILVNFNVELLFHEGIRTSINQLFKSLPD